MNILDIISATIQSQYGVGKQKADQSAQNIITNFAICAGAPVDAVQQNHATQIKICFDDCFAAAHSKNQSDVNGFEKSIIDCMCSRAKAGSAA
jgi:hypothetical protein